MIITKRFVYNLAVTGVAVMFMTSFSGSGKSLDVNTTQEIAETTSLARLTIAKGGSIIAPEGSSVSMTVDGVKKLIKAGEYK